MYIIGGPGIHGFTFVLARWHIGRNVFVDCDRRPHFAVGFGGAGRVGPESSGRAVAESAGVNLVLGKAFFPSPADCFGGADIPVCHGRRYSDCPSMWLSKDDGRMGTSARGRQECLPHWKKFEPHFRLKENSSRFPGRSPTHAKDAKIGFAIGGVLLAVLTVYVLIVPGKHKPIATNTGVNPVTTPGAGDQPPQPTPPVQANSTDNQARTPDKPGPDKADPVASYGAAWDKIFPNQAGGPLPMMSSNPGPGEADAAGQQTAQQTSAMHPDQVAQGTTPPTDPPT